MATSRQASTRFRLTWPLLVHSADLGPDRELTKDQTLAPALYLTRLGETMLMLLLTRVVHAAGTSFPFAHTDAPYPRQ